MDDGQVKEIEEESISKPKLINTMKPSVKAKPGAPNGGHAEPRFNTKTLVDE